MRRVREKDAAEEERKKKEAEAAKREEEWQMDWEYRAREQNLKKKSEDAAKEHQRQFEENSKKSWILENAKRDRKDRLHLERVATEARLIREERAEVEEAKTESHVFFDSVVQLARDLREKEEIAEEVRKRKAKGEGAFSTQG